MNTGLWSHAPRAVFGLAGIKGTARKDKSVAGEISPNTWHSVKRVGAIEGSTV